MKNLTVHITPHDLELTSALRDFVQIKIAALRRFAGDILAAEVILRGPSGATHLSSVTARLALPGRDVQARAMHENIYRAINKLVARLARLSRKRKTRRTRTARHLEKKRTKPSPLRASFGFAL